MNQTIHAKLNDNVTVLIDHNPRFEPLRRYLENIRFCDFVTLKNVNCISCDDIVDDVERQDKILMRSFVNNALVPRVRSLTSLVSHYQDEKVKK